MFKMKKIELNEQTIIDPQYILELAKSAGEAILEVYNSPFSVEQKKSETFKEGESPLTLADIKSNHIICSGLKEKYPQIPILSEENKEVEYPIRKDWKYFWLIDPLDGTKEFVKKNDEFTVNIALIKKNKPVMGVVYVPVKDIIYHGDYINGSYKKIGDKLIKLDKTKGESRNFRIVASKSHLNEETSEFIENLREEHKDLEIISAGSSLKLCMVAEGNADIYPRLGPTMEWDTAAAHAVVKFAGKNVIDHENNSELRYNKKNLLNNWFIVS